MRFQGLINLHGRVVRASGSRVANFGLIPSRVKSVALQLVFTTFLLKRQCGEQAGKFTCCAVGKGT